MFIGEGTAGMTPQQEYKPPPRPVIAKVEIGDVWDALRAGASDFRHAPLLGLFFGGFYSLAGLLMLALLIKFETPWMIIPIAIGFPLVGPFVAVGLYETSRRLAADEPLNWSEILSVVIKQRQRELGWMAFVVLFIFWIWIYQVRLLLALFFGLKSFSSVDGFLDAVLTTPQGLSCLATGTAVGGALAFVLFASTVIAMPLLLEREVDFITAIITSFQTVFKSPVPMLCWGIVVTGLAVLALLPAFLGLLIVLPILGHATWHLYRRAIEPME